MYRYLLPYYLVFVLDSGCACLPVPIACRVGFTLLIANATAAVNPMPCGFAQTAVLWLLRCRTLHLRLRTRPVYPHGSPFYTRFNSVSPFLPRAAVTGFPWFRTLYQRCKHTAHLPAALLYPLPYQPANCRFVVGSFMLVWLYPVTARLPFPVPRGLPPLPKQLNRRFGPV